MLQQAITPLFEALTYDALLEGARLGGSLSLKALGRGCRGWRAGRCWPRTVARILRQGRDNSLLEGCAPRGKRGGAPEIREGSVADQEGMDPKDCTARKGLVSHVSLCSRLHTSIHVMSADAEVAEALAGALCTLSARYDMALAEPGAARYPGAYRLLAHPSPDARRLVGWRGSVAASVSVQACWCRSAPVAASACLPPATPTTCRHSSSAVRTSAAPLPSPSVWQVAGMVRAWGAISDEPTLQAVLPTLQCWVGLLGHGSQPGSSSSGSSGGAPRPRFRPPAAAVWRALHGLLPLVQGEAAAALLPHVPGLADAVLTGASGAPCQLAAVPQQEAELCRWFAVGCWSHLLAAAGAEVFYHASSPAPTIVEQLVAAAAGSGGERLQKSAAEAMAATLLHALGGACSQNEAVAALRYGLLFLLHDVPHAAAAPAGQQAQQQQQQQPRYSQLTAAVAEAAAYSTLLQLLRQGGAAAGAALACSHFWLGPLCAAVVQRSSPPAQRRNPTRFAAADRGAWRLAAAAAACDVAALLSAAGADGGAAARIAARLPGAEDAAVAGAAAAAANEPGGWHCLPAVWQALVEAGCGSGAEAQAAGALLLAAGAALCSSSGSGGGGGSGGSRPGGKPGIRGTTHEAALAPGLSSAGGGFSLPGLSSSLAADVEAAQRLPPSRALRARFLAAGEALGGIQEGLYVGMPLFVQPLAVCQPFVGVVAARPKRLVPTFPPCVQPPERPPLLPWPSAAALRSCQSSCSTPLQSWRRR